MKSYDVIVIGAGHNGLIAAFYLAKSGKSVLVLEQKNATGGMALSSSHPEYKYPGSIYNSHFLASKVYKDLRLKKRGIEIIPFDPVSCLVYAPDKCLIQWSDSKKFSEELAKYSEQDAKNYQDYLKFLKRIGRLVGMIVTQTPPEVMSPKTTDLFSFTKMAVKLRSFGYKQMMDVLRIAPMSMRDFLDEQFTSEPIKTLLAAQGLMGNYLGPYSPGTASLLLYQSARLHKKHATIPGYPQGGMENASVAMADSLKNRGGEIYTESKVEQIIIEEGKAIGVKLASGEEIRAKVVVSGIDVQSTFAKLVDISEMPPKFFQRIKSIRNKGIAAVLNFTVDKLPQLPCFSENPELNPGQIYIAPDVDYIEKACDQVKYGRFSTEPLLMLSIPTLFAPSLVSEKGKKHIVSVLAQYAPLNLKEGDWEQHREAFTNAVEDCIEKYAPGFKASILHKQTFTPFDLEKEYGITGGHIFHADHTLDQLFVMRPIPGCSRYQTPIDNLYLCSAGTHPGGVICGLSGKNSSHKILKDWKKITT